MNEAVALVAVEDIELADRENISEEAKEALDILFEDCDSKVEIIDVWEVYDDGERIYENI